MPPCLLVQVANFFCLRLCDGLWQCTVGCKAAAVYSRLQEESKPGPILFVLIFLPFFPGGKMSKKRVGTKVQYGPVFPAFALDSSCKRL